MNWTLSTLAAALLLPSASALAHPAQDPVMLGYFMPTAGQWGKNYFDPKINNGYDVVVQAFTKINCMTDRQCSLQDQYGLTPEQIKANITKAKANGLKLALMSVTWQGLDNFNVGSSDPEHVGVLASKIVAYLNAAGFEGIDFDLEQLLSLKGWSGDTLHLLIEDIRKDKPGVVVTAAPQLNEDPSGKYILVSTGIAREHDQAIKAGDFDYLVVQEANTFQDEKTPDIVSKSYANLTAPDADLKIPEKTKLLMDVLSGPNVNPGNPNTVWYGCNGAAAYDAASPAGTGSCSDIFKQLAANYHGLLGQPLFGGAATWSINQDEANHWNWARNIGPAIH
jgi:chitinase